MTNREHPVALQLSTSTYPGHYRFPARDLLLRGPVRVPIESQPLGISYDPHTDQFVIVCYFEPQVMLGKIRQENDDLVMDVSFVKGAEGTTRLFPDFFAGDHNRMQTAFLDAGGNLCVTRNSDRKIFVISPNQAEGEKPWKLSGTIEFPDDMEKGTMVHSLLYDVGTVSTIESDVKCEKWTINFYEKMEGSTVLTRGAKEEIVPFRYGLGVDGDGDMYTITDFRTKELPGIYLLGRGLTNLGRSIPGLCGNSIAFHPEGWAIVTQYGHSIGQPGALVFVPAHIFW